MPETLQSRPSSNRLLRLLTLAHARWVAIAVTAYCAFWPLLRATLRLEIKYNEGWNAYNAAAIAHHQWVYPVRYGWTMTNYPVLSFVAVAQMGRLTHDYLYAGRLLNWLGMYRVLPVRGRHCGAPHRLAALGCDRRSAVPGADSHLRGRATSA